METDELDNALAILVASTRSKRRVLSLVEINEWLQIALGKLGSYEAVASRLGITAKMLRQFSYVSRLSAPVRRLFANRSLDSVDAAAHLAMLPKRDQAGVARLIAARVLNTADVRAISELRKRRPGESIDAVISEVTKSKTQRHYVYEFVIRGTVDSRALHNLFAKHLPRTEIVRVETDGPFGRLVVTREGKSRLMTEAKRRHQSVKGLLPEILSGASSE